MKILKYGGFFRDQSGLNNLPSIRELKQILNLKDDFTFELVDDQIESFCSKSKFLTGNILQFRAHNFPCKNPEKVGKLRAIWKILSIFLNNTNFGITLENQKLTALFLDNIVVKTSFIFMPTFFHYSSVQNSSYSRNIRHDARNFPS